MDIGRQRGRRCQDGRAVQGAAFRSQSTHVGVGSNPTPNTSIKIKLLNGANESCETTFFTSF